MGERIEFGVNEVGPGERRPFEKREAMLLVNHSTKAI
jgi:hypothetical protein